MQISTEVGIHGQGYSRQPGSHCVYFCDADVFDMRWMSDDFVELLHVYVLRSSGMY